jgi:fructose-bisphosphate aldolase class II
LAITGAIRRVFAQNPAEFDPRTYLKPARAAMQKVCEDRMVSFGQAGQASRIRQTSLDEMARRYLT